MTKIILHGLLTEYIRQLLDCVDKAQEQLLAAGRVEKIRYMAWNIGPGFGSIADDISRAFLPPNAETPPDQWHWKEKAELHPALQELSDTIGRMSEFADRLLENNE